MAQLREWLEADSPQLLVIETSGSTGQSKRVLLTREAIVASAQSSAARVGTGRWALLLPSNYVAGVQVIVRSLLAGHDPVLGALADEQGAAACVSLVGTQLHRMLGDPDQVAALAALDLVLLGGGPVNPVERAAAEAAGVRIVATYGASETAGGCVYDGVPLDGVEVSIDPDGRIRLGGPSIFSGYDGDPELTAATLQHGWYLTSDAGALTEQGTLQVLGRLDDVAITGGVKVPLPAVAARLRECPDLGLVEVLAVDDETWGQRVVAFTEPPPADVSEPSTLRDLAALRDFVAHTLPRSWAPRQWIQREMPLLSNGKIDRRALTAAVVEPGTAHDRET